MKHLERATIIEDTTAGAANPGDYYDINKELKFFIPDLRPINPVTNTSWEGVCVIPHIITDQNNVFEKAYDFAKEMAEERQ